MPAQTAVPPALECHPVTPERWPDLKTLFGEQGAYAGCWCMWWRLSRAEFGRQSREERKQSLKGIVDSGQIPGILAYADGEPVGWCSVGPRETYPSLERSRTLKRVDDQSVWAIVCFFVAAPFRGKGLMTALLQAAVDYARQNGARIVEGYPVEPGEASLPPVSSFTGVVSAFRTAGFVEVQRRSAHQPIMRYVIGEQ